MKTISKWFSLVALLLLVSGTAQAATWQIDTDHSSVSFKIRHLVSKTSGEFAQWSGTIEFGDDLTAGSVEISIDAASIDTHSEDRDQHLRGEDFFDVEQHPTITFKSTKITKDGDEYLMAGELTILGVTKAIEFNFEFHGTGKDPWGNNKAGFSAVAKVNRKDFGMVYNAALDQGGVMLGDVVTLSIEIEALELVEGR